MVVMLGFVALAIDVGAMYHERAQLQTGADAAALAIAQDCGKGINCTGPATHPLARQVAQLNVHDGSVEVAEPKVVANTVRVTTSTLDAKGVGSLALTFAPVLGIDEAKVNATASASWGAPISGSAVFPVAFAKCEFNLDGMPQSITFDSKGGTLCSQYDLNGNLNPPGGFAWIGSDSDGSCAQQVTAGSQIQSTGTSLPQDCHNQSAALLQNKTILIPIYDEKGGQGSSGWYNIIAWAAFQVEGYSFSGGTAWNAAKVTQNCGGNCFGIYGRFVQFTSLDSNYTIGGPSDYGVSIVKLDE